MPRVPTYETQVETRALPNVRVRAPQPGDDVGALGAGLQNAGTSLANIALRQQQNENVVAVMGAETALKDSYREFETQSRARKGVNAWNVTKDAQEWWRTNANEIAGTLGNDEQRSIFRLTANELRQRSLDGFAHFEATERQAAVEESTKASIAGSINLAARNPTDMAAVAASRDDVLKRVLMMGRAGGWTPERLEVEAQQTLTELHAQVLENLTDIDPAAAREYFEANKGDIAGTELDTLNSIIGTGELRAKAQSATDSIMRMGLKQSDALREARKLDPDTRDEVVTRLKTRYNEIEAAQAERQKQVADVAWNVFSRTGKVESLPSAILNELDGRTLQALKNQEAGGPSETDWGLYYNLRRFAAANPEAFAQRDLRQDFGSLRETERRQLIALQEKVSDPSSLPEAASTEKQIEVALNLLEIDDKDDKGRFQSAVYTGIAEFTRQVGREPTYDEKQKIVDRMMMQGELLGGSLFGIGDPNVRLYEVAGTPEGERFDPKIPEADLDLIVEMLEREGIPVNEETIMFAFRRKKGLSDHAKTDIDHGHDTGFDAGGEQIDRTD